MGRFCFALAIACVAIACNPTSLRPGYCHNDHDCTLPNTCNLAKYMCEDPNDGSVDKSDVGDGGAGRDGGDAEVAFYCTDNTQCGDAGATVCMQDGGMCVECLEDNHCSEATKPICNLSTKKCERCTTDSQCLSKEPNPGICMSHQDGRCATDSETIYVESKSGCLSAIMPTGGTMATPFCRLQDALSALGTRRLLFVRGSADVGNTSIQNLAGTQISIVGPGTRITAAVGSPGLKVTGSDVYVRGIKILGDSGTDIGIVADGGATLRLDGVTVENMAKGGLRVLSAGYEVINSLFAGNGGTIDEGGRFIGGVFLGMPPGTQPARFAFNTVVMNKDKGAICEMMLQVIEASLLANNAGGGGTPDASNCSLSQSKVTADGLPNLTTADPKYRLTASSPCRNAVTPAPANAPDHDIDGTRRPQEGVLDCGADEF